MNHPTETLNEAAINPELADDWNKATDVNGGEKLHHAAR